MMFALNTLSTNVVIANPASPSGPGSATGAWAGTGRASSGSATNTGGAAGWFGTTVPEARMSASEARMSAVVMLPPPFILHSGQHAIPVPARATTDLTPPGEKVRCPFTAATGTALRAATAGAPAPAGAAPTQRCGPAPADAGRPAGPVRTLPAPLATAGPRPHSAPIVTSGPKARATAPADWSTRSPDPHPGGHHHPQSHHRHSPTGTRTLVPSRTRPIRPAQRARRKPTAPGPHRHELLNTTLPTPCGPPAPP